MITDIDTHAHTHTRALAYSPVIHSQYQNCLNCHIRSVLPSMPPIGYWVSRQLPTNSASYSKSADRANSVNLRVVLKGLGRNASTMTTLLKNKDTKSTKRQHRPGRVCAVWDEGFHPQTVCYFLNDSPHSVLRYKTITTKLTVLTVLNALTFVSETSVWSVCWKHARYHLHKGFLCALAITGNTGISFYLPLNAYQEFKSSDVFAIDGSYCCR